MQIRRCHNWEWVTGLMLGSVWTAGCEYESPCENTASCPIKRGDGGSEEVDGDVNPGAPDTGVLTESATAKQDGAVFSDSPGAQETDDFDPTSLSMLPTLQPATTTDGAGSSTDADAPDGGAIATDMDAGREPTEEPRCECKGDAACMDTGGMPGCADPCVTDNGGCDPLTACTQTTPGAECGACPSGYAGDGMTGCAPILLDLSLSHGTLEPDLEPNRYSYDVTVPVLIQHLTLMPSVPSEATLAIRGAAVSSGSGWTTPSLNLGLNTFSLVVEQAGQPTTTYALRVTRGTADPTYLKASNTEIDDWFGRAVALSGDGRTLAVAATGEDSKATGIGGDEHDNSAPYAGAVYVFVWDGDGWSSQAYIKASNIEEGDEFGASLALSADGNILAVGATGEDSSIPGTSGTGQDDNDASSAGAVYVFTRSGSGWAQQAYLKASNAGQGDGYGAAVALSDDGETLAVGAPYEDSGSTGVSSAGQSNDDATSAGAAYVFSRNGNTWSQQGYLKASDAAAFCYFGDSITVAGDGRTLAVGAYGADDVDGDIVDSGAAYVFTRSGSTWSQQAHLESSNSDEDDRFGGAVALSRDGNTLAVSAYGEAGDGSDESNNDSPNSGAVYVFSRSAVTWSERAYLKASNADASDYFGRRVDISDSGDLLAVGTTNEQSSGTLMSSNQDDNSASFAGAVYIFSRSGSGWSHQAYVKATNTGAGDFFGESLSLSGDGQVLAVGAPNEDSSFLGTSGAGQSNEDADNAGAVYIYR